MNRFFQSEFGLHLREMARHWRLILLASLVAGLAVFGLRVSRPQTYLSEATLHVSVVELPGDDGSVTEFRTRSLAELAGSADVIRATIAQSEVDDTEDEVRAGIGVVLKDTPGYLDLSATGSTPEDSAALVNALATVLIDKAAPSQDSGTEQISVELIESAIPDNATSSVTTGGAISAGLVAMLITGILLGEGVVALRVLRGRFSPIDPAAEIEHLVGAPTLDARSMMSGEATVPFFVEHLRGRPVLTVVQSAAHASTEIARSLAGLSGEVHQRVLLVDGDVGRPTLHAAFGQDASPGVSDVVLGRTSLRAAIRPATGGSRAAILTAGWPQTAASSGVNQVRALQDMLPLAGADQVLISVTQSSGLDGMLLIGHAFPNAIVLVLDPSDLRVKRVRQLVDQLRGVGGSIVAVVLAPSPTSPLPAIVGESGQLAKPRA